MNVYERPESQRYWVVRAQGGDYIPHFKLSGTVAIGHLDELNFEEIATFFPDLKKLETKIKSAEPKEGNWERRAGIRFGQVKTFLTEISIGDLVVSIDSSSIMIGRVIGHPKIDKQPVRLRIGPEQYSDMSFTLRRDINWGPKISRRALPYAFQRTITARQTVFCIDAHWDRLLHLLYPVFISNNKIYFSTKIDQKESINNYRVSRFLLVMSELEALTRYFAEGYNENTVFEDFLMRIAPELSLVTKAEFMSRGNIWNHLGFSDREGKWISIIVLLYGAVFGVDLEVVKFDGVIPVELRVEIGKKLIERLDLHNFDSIKDSLQLNLPNYRTEPLEDSSKDSASDQRQMDILEDYQNV